VPASASDHSAAGRSTDSPQACLCSMSNTGLRAVGGVAKKGAKKAAAGFSGALLVEELGKRHQVPALPTRLQQQTFPKV